MVQFEVREGIEREQTPEADLARCHQVLEEGDKFESSILRLDRCFLALLRMDTYLLRTFGNAPRLLSVRFSFQEEKASCLKTNPSPQDSVYHGWEEG